MHISDTQKLNLGDSHTNAKQRHPVSANEVSQSLAEIGSAADSVKDDLKNPEIRESEGFQVYLASKQKYSEVYRRLADS